ncbi:MAG: DUF5615 family PIN-like protein [Pseudomonadota bacterium]
MRFLIDMNLSPRWVEVFHRHGWAGVHWSSICDPRASDRTLMDRARVNGYVVFTNDLDLGVILDASAGGVRSCFLNRNIQSAAVRWPALFKKQDLTPPSCEAISVLDEIIAKYPNSGDAYILLGGIYKKQGKEAEAEEVYNKGLAVGSIPLPYKVRMKMRLEALKGTSPEAQDK